MLSGVSMNLIKLLAYVRAMIQLTDICLYHRSNIPGLGFHFIATISYANYLFYACSYTSYQSIHAEISNVLDDQKSRVLQSYCVHAHTHLDGYESLLHMLALV